MIIETCVQGSAEWKKARCGVITASNFKAVLSKGQGKTRKAYMQKLAAEIIDGCTIDGFESDAMARGTALEPRAREKYVYKTKNEVREVGLIYLDEERKISCSPDGLIAENGGIEIKCPLPHTHEKYCKNRKMPMQYKAQIQGNLWITGRKWWDFVSYAPEFPKSHEIMVCRVHRDNIYIHKLAREIKRFHDELQAYTKRL